MKNILLALGILLMFSACNEQDIPGYSGRDFVQFGDNETYKYSFVISGSKVVRDTVWVRAFCSGSLGKDIRHFKLEQVPEYVFSYIYDEKGSIIDSMLIKQDNQAEPSVHYVPFDDPGYLELCNVPKDSVTFNVPVILLRDASLKEKEKALSFQFIMNDDFEPGDPETGIMKFLISDMLFYPEAWSNYTTRPELVGSSPIFGHYGKIKHQMLIDVSGGPWDNEYIDGLSYEKKLFYKNLAAKELQKINEAREAKGEPKLREDPDNPNTEIYFP